MKLFNKKIIKTWALVLPLIALGSNLSAGDLIELSKEIKKSFPVSEEAYIEIENKYGDITFEHWKEDSVKFEIEIIVRSTKSHNLHDMLDKINVDFTSSSSFVLAETNWADRVSFFTKTGYDLKQGLGSEDKIEVNYIVHLPNWIPLDVTNRFGNVFLGKHEGELEVFVSYGDFRAREIKKGKKIEVKFGKLKVRSIDYANLKLGGSKSADIGSARELIIESSSSEIEIAEVVNLNMRSKHDEIYIEEVQELQGSFTLSDTKIQRLTNNMSTNLKLGSVRIIETDAMAEKIMVEGSKADIFIGIPDFFDGVIDLDLTNDPDSWEYPKLEVISKGVGEDKRYRIKGKMGTGEGPLVQVTNTQGYVQIGN